MSHISAGLFLLVSAALVAAGYDHIQAPPPQTYITAPVERGSIANVVKATGTVNAVLTVDVSSQLSGRVADVLVGFNDAVRAGQPIARIDPELYAAKVSEARAALKIAKANVEMQRASVERAKASQANARSARTMAEAQLSALRAKFEETERQLQRKIALSRTSAGSEADLTRARSQRDAEAADLKGAIEQVKMKGDAILIAEAEVQMAAANLQNAAAVVEQKQAALQQAEVDLERTEIRAPINGVVIKREVNPGQTVAVSLKAETLFKIANDLREMEVHGKIDEADVGRLKVGQAATFTVDAYPDRVFTGRVLQVRKAPEVTQNVVTYTAVVSAPNPDELLFPGMTASLRIVIDERPNALKIPGQALRFRPGKDNSGAALASAPTTVWVLDDTGKPAPVRVQIGQSDEFGSELLAGEITQGQRIIVGVATPAAQPGFFGLRLGI